MNKVKAVPVQRLKQAGLRVTPQRIAILNELSDDFSHPNADVIYQRLKKYHSNLSFDTVNRTLNTFTQKGLLGVVEGHGDPKRYDGSVLPHHHFYCLECNRIEDFNDAGLDAIKVPTSIAKHNKIIKKRVVLEGVCSRCSRK